MAMRMTKVIAAPPASPACPPGRGRRAARGARRPAPRARRRASPARAWSCRARCTSSSSSMMCRPVVESRLPVGSSASTIGGSLASARAIATRCCSPPRAATGSGAAIGQADLLEQPRARDARRARRRSPSARGCSRTRSATAPDGRTGRRSRSSRRAAARARPRSSVVMSVPSIRMSPWSAHRARRAVRAAWTCRCPTGRPPRRIAPTEWIVEGMQNRQRMAAALDRLGYAAQLNHRYWSCRGSVRARARGLASMIRAPRVGMDAVAIVQARECRRRRPGRTGRRPRRAFARSRKTCPNSAAYRRRRNWAALPCP